MKQKALLRQEAGQQQKEAQDTWKKACQPYVKIRGLKEEGQGL